MAFRLFLLLSFVVLGRPQDFLTFLQPVRPALMLTLLAMAALVFGNHRRELAAALSTAEAKRYLLFFGIMILGIPLAYHRRIAFETVLLLYSSNIIFFVLLVSLVTSLDRLRQLIWVICLSTCVYSILGGLLEIVGSAQVGRFQVGIKMFDANDTAYVLLSLFPLCLYYLQFNQGLLKRLLAVAAAGGAIATILLTASRGGILGLGAIALILFLRPTAHIRTGQKIALAFALVAAWLLLMDRIDIERYLTLTDISSDYNLSSEGGRLTLWKAAVELALTNPVTGVGVNCFSWAHLLDKIADGDTYLAEHAVHNSFLQVAAEVGLFGFAIYVLIAVRSLLTFLRLSRPQPQTQSPENSEIGALAGLMLLGFVGLLVSGFFLTQGYSIFTTLYFGLAAALTRIEAASQAATGPTPEAAVIPNSDPDDDGELGRERPIKAWSRTSPPQA